VLITGTHEATPAVINRFYGNRRLLESFTWERLPESYHGSGCTLASACAATFAHGFDPMHAVAEAQDYTWHTLKNGLRLGMGQFLPDRLYWARETPEDAK
jgi:hydroxymethylpyrimidine/phosphomethylpyrimidine kinase